MTVAQAINKVLSIADNEAGYLEKKSNACLYDKTANAGSANYTKYWADIAPSLQGQPWCAEFISWVLTQAFGCEIAEALLGHYPYISCIRGKAKAQAQNRWTRTPSKAAIIIFGDANGTPCHTGFVRTYDNSYVYTIEGNTSGGSTVIANGGGVYKKSYTRGISRILGYWHIDYEYAAKKMSEKEGELTMTQYEKLKKQITAQDAEIAELKAKIAERTGYYNYIDKNMPDSYKPTIQKLVNSGFMHGDENGNLMLTIDAMRTYTILDRILTAAGIDVSKLKYTGKNY